MSKECQADGVFYGDDMTNPSPPLHSCNGYGCEVCEPRPTAGVFQLVLNGKVIAEAPAHTVYPGDTISITLAANVS